MIWHDVSELPREGSLCILEDSGNNGTLSYRIARYVPSRDKKYPWQLENGTYADGKRVTRWMSMNSVFQECAQIGQRPTRTFDTSDWRDRLCIEYFQLCDRIDKAERQLNVKAFTDDALKLLFEQRGYMLQYKDVLFRRICDFGIDMYREDQWQEP